MELNQDDLQKLDEQAEVDCNRDYTNRTVLQFEFDEHRCDPSLEAHLPPIVRLSEQLFGPDASSPLDLASRPAPQRTAWALLDDRQRGVIFHHDRQVQGTVADEGEYIDVFWTTVGLPNAFASCFSFGRYFLGGDYDLCLNPIVSINSNLPVELHQAAVDEYVGSMFRLGFPLARESKQSIRMKGPN